MKILVPIDGSEASQDALEFGIDMANAFEAELAVIHVTDTRTSATESIVETASEVLTDRGLDVEPEVIAFEDVNSIGSSTTVGKHLLELIDQRDYDHVVMGTHDDSGRLESMLIGSASKPVLEDADIPVTIVR